MPLSLPTEFSLGSGLLCPIAVPAVAAVGDSLGRPLFGPPAWVLQPGGRMASTGPSRVQVIHFGNYSNGEGMNRRSYRFDRRAPHFILISTAEETLVVVLQRPSGRCRPHSRQHLSIVDAVAEQLGIGSTADSDACDALTRDVASL